MGEEPRQLLINMAMACLKPGIDEETCGYIRTLIMNLERLVRQQSEALTIAEAKNSDLHRSIDRMSDKLLRALKEEREGKGVENI